MSAVSLVMRILQDDPKIVANVFYAMAAQPSDRPYIAVSLVHESQVVTLPTAVDHFRSRVSVSIVTDSPIECDRIAACVIRCLGYVIHRDITDSDDSSPMQWEDVSILKASGDMLDFNDERETYRRIIDFNVDWKTCD